MAWLDPAQWPDVPTPCNDEEVAALRRCRLIIAADGCLRAVDDPDRPLQITAGSGAEITNIPDALIGGGALVSEDAVSKGRGFWSKCSTSSGFHRLWCATHSPRRTYVLTTRRVWFNSVISAIFGIVCRRVKPKYCRLF
jgi:hypothetical protein